MKAQHVKFLKQLSQTVLPGRYRPTLAWLYFGATANFYRGDQVSCPCCGGQFSQFISASTGRDNVVCPRCLSLERHRLLWLYFQARTSLFSQPAKLLHIAPELSFYHAFKQLHHLDYVPADLNSPLATVRMDITHIQYPDDTFDVIVCNHVLEHIPDDDKAMCELYRVLKPGGWAVIQSPLDTQLAETFEDAAIITPQQRLQYYKHEDHKRLYGRDYVHRLEAVGFRVTVDAYVKTLSAETVREYGLSVNEDIYHCAK